MLARGRDDGAEIEPSALEIVSRALDRQDLGGSRDGPHRLAQLGDRAERIGGAVNEEGGNLQAREVLGAQALGFAGRVQGVGQQEESLDEPRFVGGKHRRLAPAIGLPAKDDLARNEGAQRGDGASEAGAVGGSLRWRGWTFRPFLAKRQVDPQHREPGFAKRFRQRDEEGAVQLRPAPCVTTNPAPGVPSGRCRKPRTPSASNGTI